MQSLAVCRYVFSLSAAVTLLAGCNGSQPPGASSGALLQAAARTKIQHIVLLVQEARSFNDLFATTKMGCMLVGHGKHARKKMIALKEVGLEDRAGIPTGYYNYRLAYNNGTMCGFNLEGGGLAPYRYVNPDDIRPYLTAAANYALADRMFQTQGSGDFTAHQVTRLSQRPPIFTRMSPIR